MNMERAIAGEGVRSPLVGEAVSEMPAVGKNSRTRYLVPYNTVGALVLVAIVGWLVWFSAHLAATRIYQVDECQNLYMARILAAGQAKEFFTNGSLFLLGPLSWITRANVSSETMFSYARLLFLGVFWLNLFLIARIAAGRIVSMKGLIALAAVATLAPLWDYGFEVRHDNLVLTGILLIWWAVRGRAAERVGKKFHTSLDFGAAANGGPFAVRWGYALAGAITVALLFVAVKSVVYVLPLSLGILAFPLQPNGRSRVHLAIAWAGGALVTLVAIRLCYGFGGNWDIYLSVFRGVADYSATGAGGSPRFAPWFTLGRLLDQAPLLVALCVAACIGALLELKRNGKAALNWNGMLPEALLFVGSMAALFLNPNPFPYNLLLMVPFAFLLVFRYAAGIWEHLENKSALLPALGSVALFVHGVPFAADLRRHAAHSNVRQEYVMRLAERLTDPAKDPVYDAIGMVLTRPSINFQWYLHSLNIGRFVSGAGPKLRDMLSERPAAVFIPSYRTDWLPDEDQEFIRSRYVEVADDFWVLGKVLVAGGGEFEIVHAGRYRISTLEGSDLAGTFPGGLAGLNTPEQDGKLSGKLDRAELTGQPVWLEKGGHRLQCATGEKAAVVWVGPQVERLHRIGSGDHQALFVNWY